MRYKIQVTETLRRTVEVEADNEEEAMETVEEMCNDGDIELDAEDFESRDVELLYGDDDV